MAHHTFAAYLTDAMKKLDPPSDWCDILELALESIGCNFRQKYCVEQLSKALEVGLRFGMIRELNGKYYLYEYGKVDSDGSVTYDFTENVLSEIIDTDETEESELDKTGTSSDEILKNNMNLMEIEKICGNTYSAGDGEFPKDLLTALNEHIEALGRDAELDKTSSSSDMILKGFNYAPIENTPLCGNADSEGIGEFLRGLLTELVEHIEDSGLDNTKSSHDQIFLPIGYISVCGNAHSEGSDDFSETLPADETENIFCGNGPKIICCQNENQIISFPLKRKTMYEIQLIVKRMRK